MSSSTSKIVCDTGSGHHLLKIEGYSNTQRALRSGQRAMSAPLTVAGHWWTIGYYPNGVTDSFRRYISLYLFLSGYVASPVTARVQFTLATAAEERLGSKKTNPSPIKPGEVKRVDNGQWACGKFIKRVDLEKSKNLIDDSFTVRCDIVVINGFRAERSVPAVPRASFTVPPSDLGRYLGRLLETGSGADATFEVAGERFEVAGKRIDVGTVENILALAEPLGSHELKDACLDFLKSSGDLSAAMKASYPSLVRELIARCSTDTP